MKWIAEIKIPKHLRAVIDYDEFAGYYIYIYENNNQRCTWDYLQDTLKIAKRFALEKFGFPLNSWQPMESQQL